MSNKYSDHRSLTVSSLFLYFFYFYLTNLRMMTKINCQTIFKLNLLLVSMQREGRDSQGEICNVVTFKQQ